MSGGLGKASRVHGTFPLLAARMPFAWNLVISSARPCAWNPLTHPVSL
jgi:hypothetical protein